MPNPRIAFIVDENLPLDLFGPALEQRGHSARSMRIRTKDPTILEEAEQTDSVIITSDKWFYDQLRKSNTNPRRRYVRAGVILVPGSIGKPVVPLFMKRIALIESQYAEAQLRLDRRVVIWVQQGQVVLD